MSRRAGGLQLPRAEKHLIGLSGVAPQHAMHVTRARKAADEARDEVSRGIDPIDARRSEREAQRKGASQAKAQADAAETTLRGYARIYHEKHVEPLRTVKHAQQWINSIEQHVSASLLDTTIDRITAGDLLNAELHAAHDDLDGAVRAFLALALADLGREREAVAISLTALSHYLPRYNRSLARYAAELTQTAR
jgi:hypothetical protein